MSSRKSGARPESVQASIYFGARNLDPKLGRWLSEDPALLEYLPVPETSDDAKKHNGQLPGMGGVFNAVNLNLWHYGGNNPIRLVDPDGRQPIDVYNPGQNDVKPMAMPFSNLDNRRLSPSERSLVIEIFGRGMFLENVLGVEVHRAKNSLLNHPHAESGKIFLNDRGFNMNFGLNPTGDLDQVNIFFHELWHTVQDKKDPFLAFKIIFGEQLPHVFGGDNPYSGGMVYTMDDIEEMRSFSDLSYESQAKFVGDFSERYLRARYGNSLNGDQMKVLRGMAYKLINILNSEATRWVFDQ